ncbi:hypothetical protein IPA_02555 [Ignicoccus pacificus DSM 13166]|uniref:WD40 repeat domain-containing protein n=1 Tax=Ignicoccus pacificus DSM 13166 TaxID=940294 RepID=A0A977PKP6_9CREN|nr:hypothetical protein IPA_02555 [Ignicoccus pacificus DSM 13166]
MVIEVRERRGRVSSKLKASISDVLLNKVFCNAKNVTIKVSKNFVEFCPLSRGIWTIWGYKTGGRVKALMFSENGKLGVASYDKCAYIFDQDGNIISRRCGSSVMHDVSYCCNKFGFVNDDAHAYIYDLENEKWSKLYVSTLHRSTISMFQEGFLVAQYRIARFRFDGTKEWDVKVGQEVNDTVIHGEYIYVVNGRNLSVLKISNGENVKTIRLDRNILNAQVCNNYLALGSNNHIYIYDITDPENPVPLLQTELTERSLDMAFSPSCKYLAIVGINNIKAYNINGDIDFVKIFDNAAPVSVAWWKEDKVAVGFKHGEIYEFQISLDTYPIQTITRKIFDSLNNYQREGLFYCYYKIRDAKMCLSVIKRFEDERAYLLGKCIYLGSRPNSCIESLKVNKLSLKKLRKYRFGTTGGKVYATTFSNNGELGVATRRCAYVFNEDGKLIARECGGGRMSDVSYCCNKFGFVNRNDRAYIYDMKRGAWDQIRVGYSHHWAITILQEGFLVGRSKLAYFTFDGSKIWDVEIPWIPHGPAVYGKYIYVPRFEWHSEGINALTILELPSGDELRTITFDEKVRDVQVCGRYLALSTIHHIHLYNLNDPIDPELLWKRGGIASRCIREGCGGAVSVAFSSNCKYILGADYDDKRIHIFDINGNKILEREFESYVLSVAWQQDKIAIGLGNGRVYIFEVEEQ